MIRHVVCYKFKDGSEENRNKAAEAFLSMKGVVPEVLDIEVGSDFLASARSFDFLLCVTLADRAALDAYQQNEYHCQKVKPVMHDLAEKSVSVDYVFD